MTRAFSGFPVRTWPAGRPLWRIHRADRDAWWFSADGSGRFDPYGADGLGACYLAQQPLGAFVEVIRTRLELDEYDVAAGRLAQVSFDRALRLADLCSRRALAFGVTAEASAGGDYTASHALARGAAQAGFDGVCWWVRHDPAQRLVGVALFGPAGAPHATDARLPAATSTRLDERLLGQARRAFGYRVLPRPA